MHHANTHECKHTHYTYSHTTQHTHKYSTPRMYTTETNTLQTQHTPYRSHTHTHSLQITHLVYSWGCYSDNQTTTSDGWDHFACRVTTQNQSTCANIFLHGPPEGMLSILSQTINFRQQNHCDNYKHSWIKSKNGTRHTLIHQNECNTCSLTKTTIRPVIFFKNDRNPLQMLTPWLILQLKEWIDPK